MNLAAMRTKYGVTSTNLSVLIDAFANAKGYYNAWYGTEYLNNRIIEIFNLAVEKNKTLRQQMQL